MPRFSDQWLIDRTLFDYVQGGSCACCAFNFLPNGTAGLIESMSEFETDAANAEVRALDKLPWPADMKDQVWMERVRLRQYCKRTMKTYRHFWDKHGDAYSEWFLTQTKQQLCRYFQLPRTEILEQLQKEKFHVHASFGTVLCAVTEQGQCVFVVQSTRWLGYTSYYSLLLLEFCRPFLTTCLNLTHFSLFLLFSGVL